MSVNEQITRLNQLVVTDDDVTFGDVSAFAARNATSRYLDVLRIVLNVDEENAGKASSASARAQWGVTFAHSQLCRDVDAVAEKRRLRHVLLKAVAEDAVEILHPGAVKAVMDDIFVLVEFERLSRFDLEEEIRKILRLNLFLDEDAFRIRDRRQPKSRRISD